MQEENPIVPGTALTRRTYPQWTRISADLPLGRRLPAEVEYMPWRELPVKGFDALLQLYQLRTEESVRSLSLEVKGMLSRQHEELLKKVVDTPAKADQAALKAAIARLEKENAELIIVLASKFPSRRLALATGVLTAALLANLAAWHDFGVWVVHPLLSLAMLVGTIGFFVLGGSAKP